MTKINNFRDTIQALLDGKKIKREDWTDGEFTRVDEKGQLVDELGNSGYVAFYTDGCYEIYEEPEEELKIENLKVGDVIYSNKKLESRDILGICGKVVLLSDYANPWVYATGATVAELNNQGYKLKPAKVAR